jgi:hypothetical protein
MRKAVFAILLAAAIFAAGCTTKYVARSADIEPRSRVGLVMVSEDGDKLKYGIKHAYVYNRIMAHNLIPVALNEMDVSRFMTEKPGVVFDFKSQNSPSDLQAFIPAMTPTLQAYLKDKKVDFLLVTSFWVSGLDEHMRAIMIRVSDMVIVGTKFYDYKFMVPFCVPTGLVGIGLLVCPFFYTNNYDSAIYEMAEEMLQDLTAGTSGAREAPARAEQSVQQPAAAQPQNFPEPVAPRAVP